MIRANLLQNKKVAEWFFKISLLFLLIGHFIYVRNMIKYMEAQEYKNIRLFVKAQEYLYSNDADNEALFVFNYITEVNEAIPLIWTDVDNNPRDYRNVEVPDDLSQQEKTFFLKEKTKYMSQRYPPMTIDLGQGVCNKVFYDNSHMVKTIKIYYMVETVTVLSIFGLGYAFFAISKRYEQNLLWVGLAKETAHQIATPLTSLMSWLDYLQTENDHQQEAIKEMNKDLKRFEMIMQRFSKIGSVPILKEENVFLLVEHIVQYLERRMPSKVIFSIQVDEKYIHTAVINRILLEWAIENLCRNAVDSMKGKGEINIYMHYSKNLKNMYIDVRDTGKGIDKNQWRQIFKPGFTTKKRGWGLGLTLTKRIIKEYHKGDIYVLNSQKNIGTTFRMVLPVKKYA